MITPFVPAGWTGRTAYPSDNQSRWSHGGGWTVGARPARHRRSGAKWESRTVARGARPAARRRIAESPESSQGRFRARGPRRSGVAPYPAPTLSPATPAFRRARNSSTADRHTRASPRAALSSRPCDVIDGPPFTGNVRLRAVVALVVRTVGLEPGGQEARCLRVAPRKGLRPVDHHFAWPGRPSQGVPSADFVECRLPVLGNIIVGIAQRQSGTGRVGTHRLAAERQLSSGCHIPTTRAIRVQQTRDDEQIQVSLSSALARDDLRRMPERSIADPRQCGACRRCRCSRREPSAPGAPTAAPRTGALRAPRAAWWVSRVGVS
jgi:hypothetical protein